MFNNSAGNLVLDSVISSPWFVRYQSNAAAKMKIICFHHAGGSASIFRDWGNILYPTAEVFAVQLPGRDSRFTDPFAANIIDIVNALMMDFRFALDKPFILFGHSFGALVAYEFARKLQNIGELMPSCLYVSGKDAPHLKSRGNKMIHKLPDAEFINELCKYGGMPEEILLDNDLIQILLPRLRSDFALSETYNYIEGNLLNCPIVALGGADDKYASYRGIDAWKKHTANSFQVKIFQGNHFFISSAQTLVLNFILDFINGKR